MPTGDFYPQHVTTTTLPEKPEAEVIVEEITKFLNTLFSGKIFVAHDIRSNTARILRPQEAAEYIERFFPTSYFRHGSPFYADGSLKPIYSTAGLMHWYEAEDALSRMEIRYPRTGEEDRMSVGSLSFPHLRWKANSNTKGRRMVDPLYYSNLINDLKAYHNL